MRRMIKLTLISSIALCIFAISPFATPLLQKQILPVLGVHADELRGSIWSGSFSAQHMTLPGLDAKGIKIEGISLLKQSVESISIEQCYIDASSIDTASSESGPNLSVNKIHIQRTNIVLNDHLRTIKINQLLYQRSSNFDLSFNVLHTPISISATTSSESQYKALIKIRDQQTELEITQQDNIWRIYQPNSNTPNQALASFDTQSQKFDINVQQDSAKLSIDLAAYGHISKKDWIVELKKLKLTTPYAIEASAHINMLDTHYILNLNSKDANIELATSKEKDILVSGAFSDVQEFTPLASGSIQFIAALTKDQDIYLSARSPKIELPVATLEGLDIAYIPNHASPFKMFVDNIYSPGFSIEKIAVTSIKEDDDTTKVNVLGLVHNELQSAQLTTFITPDQIDISIESLSLRNELGVWTNKSPTQLKLTASKTTLNDFCLYNNDSEACISGEYNSSDQSWHAKVTSDNFKIGLSTQGLTQYDTDIIVNQADASINVNLYGSEQTLHKTNGKISIQNIQATVTNIVPESIFPLDYTIQDGSIDLKLNDTGNHQLNGKLKSTQGDIAISTLEDTYHISSPDLNFTFGKNQIQTSLDLTISEDQLNVALQPTKLYYFPDTIAYYQSVPANLDIIRSNAEIKKPKSTKTTLKIFTDSCDINFMGFNGLASANLILNSHSAGSEQVSGNIILADPKLNILNRQIMLDNFMLSYNNQSWLDGDLKLDLSKSATFSQGSSLANQNEIYIHVGGKLSDPSVEIGSSPNMHSQLSILTQLLRESPSLPPGNENLSLIEYISGLDRKSHALSIISLINNIGTTLDIDISFQQHKQQSTRTEESDDSELVLSKKLSDRVWLIIRHQLNEQNPDVIALSLKLRSNISLEGQYNRDAIGLSFLLSN